MINSSVIQLMSSHQQGRYVDDEGKHRESFASERTSDQPTVIIPSSNATASSAPSNSKMVDKFRKTVEKVCESQVVSLTMGLLTIWTLYQGDIRDAATYKNADIVFEVIISICFFLFSLEIIGQCIYKEGYMFIPPWDIDGGEGFFQRWTRRLSIGSFYFWMDIVATGTILMDLAWMIGDDGVQAIEGGGTQTAAGGNAVRLGARIGRILRLVRMVRLVRIGKLYKYGAKILGIKAEEKTTTEDDEVNLKGSQVGSTMIDLTNRR